MQVIYAFFLVAALITKSVPTVNTDEIAKQIQALPINGAKAKLTKEIPATVKA